MSQNLYSPDRWTLATEKVSVHDTAFCPQSAVANPFKNKIYFITYFTDQFTVDTAFPTLVFSRFSFFIFFFNWVFLRELVCCLPQPNERMAIFLSTSF